MAQGYAFGRPAPLPSAADVLIGELTDTPAEQVAGPIAEGSLAEDPPTEEAEPSLFDGNADDQ
jgi:hypothetical protein